MVATADNELQPILDAYDDIMRDFAEGKKLVIAQFPDDMKFMIGPPAPDNSVRVICVICEEGKAAPMLARGAVELHNVMIQHVNLYHLTRFHDWLKHGNGDKVSVN